MTNVNPSPASVLRITRTLPAPRVRVFRAWTNAEEIKRWWGPDAFTIPSADVDLRVGGGYRIAMQPPEGPVKVLFGTYREIQSPERLVYTWCWEHDPERRETLVTVDFHEVEGDTEVIVTHEGFRDEKDRSDHVIGWNGSLDGMEKLLERRRSE